MAEKKKTAKAKLKTSAQTNKPKQAAGKNVSAGGKSKMRKSKSPKPSTISRAFAKKRASRKPAKKKSSEALKLNLKQAVVQTSPAVTASNGKHSRTGFREIDLGDLPASYNETKLVLLARDPQWAYTYWDFSSETWKWIESIRQKHQNLRYVLRIRNLDDHSFFDIDIQLETKNWYVHVGNPDAAIQAELGMIDASGKYYLIVKSNKIRMPRNKPSEEIDVNWRPENFEEIYQLSGGGKTGRSSDMASQFRKR